MDWGSDDTAGKGNGGGGRGDAPRDCGDRDDRQNRGGGGGGGGGDPKPNTSLLVRNLDFSARPDDVRQIMGKLLPPCA